VNNPGSKTSLHVFGSWAQAEGDCVMGLSMEPKNVKGLWRRGIARRELGKLEEAKAGTSSVFFSYRYRCVIYRIRS
jgi:hypothetical protein